jgi:hypothetical protein
MTSAGIRCRTCLSVTASDACPRCTWIACVGRLEGDLEETRVARVQDCLAAVDRQHEVGTTIRLGRGHRNGLGASVRPKHSGISDPDGHLPKATDLYHAKVEPRWGLA